MPPSTDVDLQLQRASRPTSPPRPVAQEAAASQAGIAAPVAPAAGDGNDEMRAQIAALTRGQAELTFQLAGLISTLNTINFGALPRLQPPGDAQPAAGELQVAVANAAAPKASPVTPSSARAPPPESFEEPQFSHTQVVPSSNTNEEELAHQDPTPRESLKARSNTPSRQLTRNASSEAPAAKHAKGPPEV